MHPILFHFGFLTIYSYGFFLALAYLTATFFFWREGRKRGFKEEKLIDFTVASLIAAIIGGRLLYFLLNQSYFSGNLGKLLAFWEGGFAFYGSFVFVILVGFYLIRKWKWDFFQIADIAALSVLIATCFGKIGSYLAGNDFGSVTHFFISVSYPSLEGARHPVQIYEAIFSLVLFLVLYRVYRERLKDISRLPSGAIFLYYLLFSSVGRMVFEQLRGDST
jgi:phosphatidylglycerol:prolipoprotein diacylglycerol transferase